MDSKYADTMNQINENLAKQAQEKHKRADETFELLKKIEGHLRVISEATEIHIYKTCVKSSLIPQKLEISGLWNPEEAPYINELVQRFRAKASEPNK